MAGKRRCAVAASASVAVLALAAPAEVQACTSARVVQPAKRLLVPRPTTGKGRYRYAAGVPVRRLVGTHAVVHWTTRGPDAPPAGDADGDRVPDYVETMSATADAALAKYSAKPGFGFREPLCDRGGPDGKPDVYIRRVALGVAVEATSADRGPFAVISPRLDPRPAPSARSLRLVVSHELFHLVQFAYVRAGMPRWIAEGTANGLGLYGAQEPGSTDLTVDAIFLTQTDRWLLEPWTSMFDEGGQCGRCYGSGVWWLEAMAEFKRPDLVTLYFERLAALRRVGLGLAPLAATFQAIGWESSQAFAQVSFALYRDGFRTTPRVQLNAGTPAGVVPEQRLLAMSTHFAPVSVPASANGLDLTIRSNGGGFFLARVVTGGPKGREVSWAPQTEQASITFPIRFQSPAEAASVMLVLTNGTEQASRYVVSWQLR